MDKVKNENSTVIVKNKDGEVVGYLTEKDEEQGKDIKLDMQGYKLIAL